MLTKYLVLRRVRRDRSSGGRDMDVEQLLTTTRSARRSLDVDAPVDLEEIRNCLDIGLHAPNGSNQQSWHWAVITDVALRQTIAELYREAYLSKVGGVARAESGEGAGAGDPVLRVELSPHARGRVFLPRNALRLDLPRSVELPAGAAFSWLRDLHHDAAFASREGSRSLAGHARKPDPRLPAASGAIAGRA